MTMRDHYPSQIARPLITPLPGNSECDRLAHRLAEQSAREVLSIFGVQKQLLGGAWLHLNDPHIRIDEREAIQIAARYLDLRGLIVRNVAFADHVRIREQPEHTT